MYTVKRNFAMGLHVCLLFRVCIHSVSDNEAEGGISHCSWRPACQLWSVSVPHFGICGGQGECLYCTMTLLLGALSLGTCTQPPVVGIHACTFIKVTGVYMYVC